MKKWRLSSSQLIPSKGMEKYRSFKHQNFDEEEENEDSYMNMEEREKLFYQGLTEDQIKWTRDPIKKDEEKHEGNLVKNDQDYTLSNSSEDENSVLEDLEILACKSPFLTIIKDFCIKDRNNEIRKGDVWKCKACCFCNFGTRLSCYKCQCWKWEDSDMKVDFPKFYPEEETNQLIRKLRMNRNKSNKDVLLPSEGPRYALIHNDTWTDLKIQKVELFCINAKRQVFRATHFTIRGGKHELNLRKLSAKVRTGPQSTNSDLSNNTDTDRKELDSLRNLIRERWWKGDENWLPDYDWTKLSVFERTMLRFKFSYSHLNVDAFTWNKFSIMEKNEFIRRKRRWIKEHTKGANEGQKKMMHFWKSRFRWKKQIFSIKDEKWKEYDNRSFLE